MSNKPSFMDFARRSAGTHTRPRSLAPAEMPYIAEKKELTLEGRVEELEKEMKKVNDKLDSTGSGNHKEIQLHINNNVTQQSSQSISAEWILAREDSEMTSRISTAIDQILNILNSELPADSYAKAESSGRELQAEVSNGKVKRSRVLDFIENCSHVSSVSAFLISVLKDLISASQ